MPYLNDAALHEEMVRFALSKIEAGHFPPDSWFPFLNIGSPQYLHYQSLGAMITALLAWVIGVANAFTWTSWLLVACWPICVYAAGRLFGLSRGAAVGAAVLSPFLSSFTRVGFEQFSYLWSGYGLWSQLWAMWTLPFAWALSWRAVEERRFVVAAAVTVAASASFHFETGYLAFAGVVLFVFVHPSQLRERTGRALLVLGGAAALAAWVIVPLVAQGEWAAVNQFLQGGADANSYGASRVLSAFFEGNLLDWHHLPLITVLFLVGLIVSLVYWRLPAGAEAVGNGAGRGLVVLFGFSLLLFFGRPTLGPLLDVLPGAEDLFLRRFVVGVQLAALFLAGIGAAWLARNAASALAWAIRRLGPGRERLASAAGAIAVGCVAIALLVPACSFVVGQGDVDSSLVARQAAAGRAGVELDDLVRTIKEEGGGRTFAGDPSDWGADFTVGEVPVYKYLASREVDEVGFTLRTASLMSDPEVEFAADNPADYRAFAIRWLILPLGMPPEVPATKLERRGRYVLWEMPADGYVQVVDTRGSIAATSSDLGSFSAVFLAALPLDDPVYPTVSYGGRPPVAGTLAAGEEPSAPPGRVLRERADLPGGTASALVSMKRKGVVLLSASYDPGWQAFVGGRPVRTEMVAPALVGVEVGPGTHRVRFVYGGFPDYPELLLLGAAGLLGLVLLERRQRSRAGRQSSTATGRVSPDR